MTPDQTLNTSDPALDVAVAELAQTKTAWAQTGTAQRIALLAEVKDCLMQVSQIWVETAARHKQIPAGSPLIGEEWTSGPYALMSACNLFMETLAKVDGKQHIAKLPVRDLGNGQIAATVVPHSIWDRLLLSGVTAEVWMQPGIIRENLAQNTASGYDTLKADRRGGVSLVLGAGNISAIAPLDCFQKLFVEHQVVILKLNPVNDYLIEVLRPALRPLIDFGALRIVTGDADVGAYLCEHAGIDDIHITGAGASHDAIVWGTGAQGVQNKAARTPKNPRRVTSELGAVCPTIVVPGPWSNADLTFQAEHLATQKMHNSGFNCIACQMLIVPDGWAKTDTLLERMKTQISKVSARPPYYPGAADRVQDFADHGHPGEGDADDGGTCVVVPFAKGGDAWLEQTEVFAPAMSILRLANDDPESYLRAAIAYANENLHGTLGANILIHPKTLRAIGKRRFDALLADLRYGCIAINAWTGLGFLLVQTPWGGFPGASPDNVQSGIGFVHNSYMFDKPERTVVRAPFRPFPRNLLSGGLSLLPRPPWFVSNRKAHKIGELLTKFQHRPSILKIPRIFLNALLG